MTSAGSVKTYPEDKVEEEKQELHALHSSLHGALNLDSEKGQKNCIRYVNCSCISSVDLNGEYCVPTNTLTNLKIGAVVGCSVVITRRT